MSFKINGLLFFFLFFIGVLSTQAQVELVRQPYLNAATQSGVTVRFRSNQLCNGIVKYGTLPTNLTAQVISQSTTEHEFTITGLQSFTKYYYQCFCDNVALTVADSSYYFKTLPINSYDGPINIWAIGDFGQANEGQIKTKEAYKKFIGDEETLGWIWLGDNAYGEGTDEQYQERVFDIYPEVMKNTVIFPAPGNHDYGSVNNVTHDGPYYQNFTMPSKGESGGRPSNTEKYYSYDIGNVHFVAINSEWSPWIYVPDLASIMINWLKLDLAQSDKQWKVVYWHQPPYSKGSHDSDDQLSIMSMMRQKVNKACENGGVDLVLNGHSHCYERSYLINGHYQTSDKYDAEVHAVSSRSGKLSLNEPYYKKKGGNQANSGTIYNVVGCSGSLSESGSLDHPVMYYSDNTHNGSLVLRFHGDTLLGKYLTANGEQLDDYAIIKSADIPTGIEKLTTESVKIELDLRIVKTANFNEVFVEFDVPSPRLIRLVLLDMNGRVLREIVSEKIVNKGSRRQFLDLNDFAIGNYIIQFTAGDEQVSKQVIR